MTMRLGIAAAAVGALLLAGCGGDKSDGDKSADAEKFAAQSADKIMAAVVKDMGELETMRMKGSATSEGEQTTIDFHMSAGGDCVGVVSQGGKDAQIRSVDGESWVEDGEHGGKWVSLGSEMPFGNTCNLSTFLEGLDGTANEYGKTATDTIDGKDVVTVELTSEGDTGKLSVLAEAPHYLVRAEQGTGEEAFSSNFSEFDEPFEVEPPAAADVVQD